ELAAAAVAAIVEMAAAGGAVIFGAIAEAVALQGEVVGPFAAPERRSDAAMQGVAQLDDAIGAGMVAHRGAAGRRDGAKAVAGGIVPDVDGAGGGQLIAH